MIRSSVDLPEPDGPEEGDELARFERQRNVVEHRRRAEALLDAPKIQARHAHPLVARQSTGSEGGGNIAEQRWFNWWMVPNAREVALFEAATLACDAAPKLPLLLAVLAVHMRMKKEAR